MVRRKRNWQRYPLLVYMDTIDAIVSPLEDPITFHPDYLRPDGGS